MDILRNSLQFMRSRLVLPAFLSSFVPVFLAAGLAVAVASPVSVAGQAQLDRSAPPDRETIDRWLSELSNWGRWGEQDERGTLNLIAPEVSVAATSLVRKGISFSHSQDYLKEAAADATSPLQHEIIRAAGSGASVSDRVDIAYHGFAHSDIDALCHMSHEGLLYNGFCHNTISEDTS